MGFPRVPYCRSGESVLSHRERQSGRERIFTPSMILPGGMYGILRVRTAVIGTWREKKACTRVRRQSPWIVGIVPRCVEFLPDQIPGA